MVKVSIITTVYKAEKDLPRLLDSMIAQKSQEVEFFLIDNGSPDRCGEICREYAQRDHRFSVFTVPENIGYIRARNLGIEKCSGDYVGFCDSDDYLEPGGYDRAIQILHETGCDLYLAAYNTVDGKGKHLCRLPYPVGLYQREQINTDILPQAFGCLADRPSLHGFAWKQIFRKNILIEEQIRFLPELQPYEDQVFNIDYIKRCIKVYVDDNILYNYLVNLESITAKLAADFHVDEEWTRIYKLYRAKEKRATTALENEALSNQMVGFLYALFLNAAKSHSDHTVRDIDQCLDKTVIKDMISRQSRKENLRTRLVSFCLRHGQYRVLLGALQLGLKIRG